MRCSTAPRWAGLVAVGPGANRLGPGGRAVMDDPVAFPPEVRPFARAHTAGLGRLREREHAHGPVDGMMLTPAGPLEHGGPRTGRYRVGGERLPGVGGGEGGERGGEPWLSYADRAGTVVDEIQGPLRHRTRVSVVKFRSEEEGGMRKEKEQGGQGRGGRRRGTYRVWPFPQLPTPPVGLSSSRR